MSIRLAYLLGLIVVSFLLLTSVYLQFMDGIMPCPLCSLQRVTFALLGIFFLIGVLLHTKFWARLLIDTLIALCSILGILLSGRQVWLQHFSSGENGECGVSLQYMAQVLPWNELMQKILEGSAECSKRGWEFLHLNLAEWSLIWFILFAFLALYLYLKEFHYLK